MKAILSTRYGPPEVLEYVEVEKPTPKENQVLVKVCAASINIADWYAMHGGPSRLFGGLFKPKDPSCGLDFAGKVEAVGKDVTIFKPGDEVFGMAQGSIAEYVCAGENRLAVKPADVSFEQAASLPVAALTALQGLRDTGHIQPGQKVLLDGASGGVGTFAIQIAKSFGAEVTAASNSRHQDTARRLGADHVIDSTHEDITRSGQQFDLIVNLNGYHSIFAYKRVLTPKGTFVMAGASSSRVFLALLEVASLGRLLSRRGGQRFTFMGICKVNTKDLDLVKELLVAGKITPVIDRLFPITQAADAFRFFGEGHKQGKVIIMV